MEAKGAKMAKEAKSSFRCFCHFCPFCFPGALQKINPQRNCGGLH
jgi:hypothetical protein